MADKGIRAREIDVEAIIGLLKRRNVDEGQPEQVAGRWIEAGFEDPAEIERLIEQGVTPEQGAEIRRARGDEPVGHTPAGDLASYD